MLKTIHYAVLVLRVSHCSSQDGKSRPSSAMAIPLYCPADPSCRTCHEVLYIYKGVITSLAEVVPAYKSHPCCSSKDRINWRRQQTLVRAAILLWRQNHFHLQAQSSVSLFPLKPHTACVATTAVFPESLVQLHKPNFYKISLHGSRLH